jgi:hypothetical protein
VDVHKVVVLMARVALNRFRAVAIGAATHLHGVTMRIVTLAREVSSGVAIHATRMVKDRKDRLKGCDGFGAVAEEVLPGGWASSLTNAGVIARKAAQTSNRTTRPLTLTSLRPLGLHCAMRRARAVE